MPNQTRRKQRGGFSFFRRKPSINNQRRKAEILRSIRIAKVKGNQGRALSGKVQTKVANWMPGAEANPTNRKKLAANTEQKIKNIEEEFKSTLAEIQKEDPVQLGSALGEIQNQIKSALTSNTSKEATVITITIGVGSAQLFIKIARIFASAMIVFCLFFPGFWPWADAFLLAAREIFPNTNFTTTKEAYAAARKLTGANKPLEKTIQVTSVGPNGLETRTEPYTGPSPPPRDPFIL